MRTALQLAARAAVGALAALALVLLVPLAFGGRPLVVLSGSMEPALATGDVAVTLPIAPLDARPGDIVTFRSPEDRGRLVTHRVRRVARQGQAVRFVTKGDANNAVERWSVGADEEIGRTVLRIPALGHALAPLRAPAGVVLFVLVPLGLLLVLELVAIWRPARDEVHGAPAR